LVSTSTDRKANRDFGGDVRPAGRNNARSMDVAAPRVTFLIGCTGCGKGGLGREWAERVGGEIISADSMKVYRRMDIGTAKPSRDAMCRVAHHLIDVVEPSVDFSVAQYVELAERAMADAHSRNKPVFVVGGTPLYVKALSEGLFDGPGADPAIRAHWHEVAAAEGRGALYDRLRSIDPAAAGRIHPNDLRRIVRALEVHELTGKRISEWQTQWDQAQPRYQCCYVGLRRSREDQSRRINERVRRMIDAGLVEEVRALRAEPLPLSATARQALGYSEIIQYLDGLVSLADAVEMIKMNTRRFAKAQRTWFRRFQSTEWIDLAPETSAAQVADVLMSRRDSPWSPSPK
jgi:tRNA dimethylallyltransferase